MGSIVPVKRITGRTVRIARRRITVVPVEVTKPTARLRIAGMEETVRPGIRRTVITIVRKEIGNRRNIGKNVRRMATMRLPLTR